jgi:photosystem II stability/assembly factor-like uncharacterized protein
VSSPTDRNEPPRDPDGLDSWLNSPIEPLLPRPGTYEAIVRRAQRRRLHRAMTAACAAAVVIAAAVVVPQLTGLLNARGVHSIAPATQPPNPSAPQPQPTASTPPAGQPTGTTAPLVPPGFAPGSVTFIGLKTGWALGRYAAQCPGSGCTALARTDDTGQHWSSVPAPGAGPPDGGSGASQVRFLNQADGWVFGPELWATHDGGQTWNKIGTGGQRVISLEATGNRVFAVFARCTGTGSGWNTGCSSYQLYSAAAGGHAWTAVPNATGRGSASLVLTGQVGYLLAHVGFAQGGESVMVSSGPVTGGGPWNAAPPLPCGQPTGQPSAAPSSTPAAGAGGSTGNARGAGPAALLAAASPQDLFLLCTAGAGGQTKAAYLSTDGGQHWQQHGSATVPGTATSVAAASSGTLLIGTDAGVYVSRDSGATWQMSLQVPDGGVGYVGMTDSLQGFAVPANQDAIWFTSDGGQSWRQSAI